MPKTVKEVYIHNDRIFKMPLFSFVIPTRNRAKYLEYAIRSCLEQSFEDYEVVVSNNNSSDDTEKVVEQLNNGKINYFNTGKDVGLTENFEYAISKARGEYVMLLADDEAYINRALEKLKYWIEKTSAAVISFGRTGFAFPGLARHGVTAEENTSGILALRPFTRKVAWVPSPLALQMAFSLKSFEEGYYARAFPLSVKSVVRRDVVLDITKRVGRFQLPPTPDWSSCIMILNSVEKVLLLDEHLHLAGEVPESWGPEFRRKRHLETNAILDTEHFSDLVPLNVNTLTNVCINAMVGGQLALRGPKNYELDYTRYFKLIEKDLRLLEGNGIDVKKDLADLVSVSKQYGIHMAAPEQRSNRMMNKIQWQLKKIRRHLFPAHVKTHVKKHSAHQWPIVVRGQTAGFKNILECARSFETIVADVKPDKHALSLFQSAYGSCEVLLE